MSGNRHFFSGKYNFFLTVFRFFKRMDGLGDDGVPDVVGQVRIRTPVVQEDDVNTANASGAGKVSLEDWPRLTWSLK